MEENGNSNVNIIDLNFVEPKVLENLFETKAEKMKTNTKLNFDNETKLKFYGLFKVATVGPISEKNKKSVGLFDFTEKYKNQAWEKCSKLSKEEAMIEYIKLYNKLTGESDAEILQNFSNVNHEDKDFLDFGSMEIPNDVETTQSVSTNAKYSKKEIDDYLLNVSDNERLFHKLKEKIYNGDLITEKYLKDFSSQNKYDILKSRDLNGQTIFHVAVDGMNNSAVQALIDLNIAQQCLNIADNYGMTPMHIAAINFDYEIFNMVSSLNPDLRIKDFENKTALDYLRENEEIEEEIKNCLENIKLY